MTKKTPPFPPLQLRTLVGPTEEHYYDNPTGELVFAEVPTEAYRFVFDFGCGCGRIARQLLQQAQPPNQYVGVDLHRGMIEWCRGNLRSSTVDFRFEHHDVYNLGFNPSGKREELPLPVGDDQVTLFVAWSVFTHVLEPAAAFYLSELSRVLAPGGIALTTWFLFDKIDYPMMQEFQNALFINAADTTNAVIFDRAWLQKTLERAGLVITRVVPPDIRGYQWWLYLERARAGLAHVAFPEDTAPPGVARAPLTPERADEIEGGGEPVEVEE